MRKESRIGLLTVSAYFIISRFINMPDIILGFLLGFSLCFLCLGILPKQTHETIKAYKSRLFHLS